MSVHRVRFTPESGLRTETIGNVADEPLRSFAIWGFLIAITYKNRDSFISVVAWMLILYGVYAGYGSLSQLILTLWLYPAATVPVFLVTILVVSLFFSAASLWCGLGLRNRQRSRLKALVYFLWLYMVWSIGLNVWFYVDHFFLSSPPDSQFPELLESMERSARHSLANTVSGSIRVVLESAAIVWLIGQFSTHLIQDEFEA